MMKWKKISERVERVNRFRSFRVVRYRMSNGAERDFYLFLHGQGKVVCALVLTQQKRVVIAKQFRLGPERVMWELPGGGINRGETPRQAIVREVLEETGYRGRPIAIGVSTNDAWSVLTRYHFVITDAVRVANPTPEAGEATEVEVISLPQLRRRIRAGDLTDAETAYRALEFLKLLRWR